MAQYEVNPKAVLKCVKAHNTIAAVYQSVRDQHKFCLSTLKDAQQRGKNGILFSGNFGYVPVSDVPVFEKRVRDFHAGWKRARKSEKFYRLIYNLPFRALPEQYSTEYAECVALDARITEMDITLGEEIEDLVGDNKAVKTLVYDFENKKTISHKQEGGHLEQWRIVMEDKERRERLLLACKR